MVEPAAPSGDTPVSTKVANNSCAFRPSTRTVSLPKAKVQA
jgi:hypothetical protein